MVAVDAIFFDLDGTLVDARTDIVNAMNYTLAKLDRPAKPFKEVVSYIGTGVSYLVSRSLGSEDAGLVDEGVRIYIDRYTAHPADEAIIYPHVKETLDFFRNKRKFILTNRYVNLADPLLEATGLKVYFEEVIGGDDENCLKPSACVFDKIIPRLKVDKKRAIIVGDMAVDIMAGKNSGIKTCWATYGLGTAAEVKSSKPDYTIGDITELKKIIK